jgi:hypothetical protein
MRLHVTEHGFAMLREGEAIFDELREQWEPEVGAEAVKGVEETLRRLLGNNPGRPDTPGWLMRDVGGDG